MTSTSCQEKQEILKRIRSAAVAAANSRKELETAVHEAWQMGIPNISIALEAGWNDANVRMLAIRRRWKRN